MHNRSLENNAVHVWGVAQPPVVLSHGFGCDQSVWSAILPTFIGRHKVVAYDLTGAGHSERRCYDQQKYGTLQGYADDLVGICESLGLCDVVFIGHSVSAMIGCLAALMKPELFSQLVLIAPSPCYANIGDYQGGSTRARLDEFVAGIGADLPAWARKVAPMFMGNPARRALAEDLCERFCRMDPKIGAHFAKVAFNSDHRADIARVQTPTLLLQCTDDIFAPLTVGNYMHEHMPANHLQVLQATGHFPHLCAPEETSAAIFRYLREHGAARSPRA